MTVNGGTLAVPVRAKKSSAEPVNRQKTDRTLIVRTANDPQSLVVKKKEIVTDTATHPHAPCTAELRQYISNSTAEAALALHRLPLSSARHVVVELGECRNRYCKDRGKALIVDTTVSLSDSIG